MENIMKVEKRKDLRFKINMNISYIICKKSETEKSFNLWRKCDVYDISRNGIGLRTNQIMMKNEILKIKIESGDKICFVNAVIMNTDGQRTGSQFIDMDKYQYDFLNKTIHNFVVNRITYKKKFLDPAMISIYDNFIRRNCR
jgi:hypothetical protein